MFKQKRFAVLVFFSCVFLANGQDGRQIYDDIKGLYPNLSDAALHEKLSNAKNPLRLLRSIVPYYYFVLKKFPPKELDVVGPLTSHTGWCVGDAHIENFGIILNEKGKPRFRMNDLDDGGPCPLYVDILRLLVSANLSNKGIDLRGMLSAYEDGLFDRDRTRTEEIQKMIKRGAERNYHDNDLVDSKNKLVRTSGVTFEVTPDQTRELKQALSVMFSGGFDLLDAVSLDRRSGGSGGLPRFLVFLQQKGAKTFNIIEFKGIQQSGIFPLATQPIPPPQERFKISIIFEQGNKALSLYSVQKVLGFDMLLRPRTKGDIGIQLSNYDDQTIGLIVNDEAAALGDVHRRSASSLAAYRQAFIQSPKKAWISAVNNMSDVFVDAFEKLKAAR